MKTFISALFLLSLNPMAIAAVPVIKADGSSTVFPITEAMAEEFQRDQKGKVRVTVGISGTGGGFKKFCRGETDIQNASRPISSSEMAKCKKAGIKYFELPVAYDATAVVVNPKNDWVDQMSVDQLKMIWEPKAQGKIMNWNQVDKKWPKESIALYGAGADSGTFDYFTAAIVGKEKSSRGDYTASEDDNTLVMGVSQDKNALGYLPFAYYMENAKKLKVVGIIGGSKAPKKEKAIKPSKETVEDGSYYPLSRPVFIYVSDKAFKKKEVQDFVEFYLSQASSFVPEVKYVALPSEAYIIAKKHLKEEKYGTAFGGHSSIGLKIQDLLKKEKAQ